MLKKNTTLGVITRKESIAKLKKKKRNYYKYIPSLLFLIFPLTNI